MHGKISEHLTQWLIKTDVITEDDYEIYEYGIRLAIMMGVNIVSTLVIGFLMKMFVESILLMLFFGSLRRYAGGYHASTPLRCFVLSAALIVMGLTISKYIDGIWIINCAVIVILGIIVFRFAPIPDANKPLTEREYERYGILAVIIYVIETGVFALGIMFQLHMLTSILASAGILLIGVLVSGIVKNKNVV